MPKRCSRAPISTPSVSSDSVSKPASYVPAKQKKNKLRRVYPVAVFADDKWFDGDVNNAIEKLFLPSLEDLHCFASSHILVDTARHFGMGESALSEAIRRLRSPYKTVVNYQTFKSFTLDQVKAIWPNYDKSLEHSQKELTSLYEHSIQTLHEAVKMNRSFTGAEISLCIKPVGSLTRFFQCYSLEYSQLKIMSYEQAIVLWGESYLRLAPRQVFVLEDDKECPGKGSNKRPRDEEPDVIDQLYDTLASTSSHQSFDFTLSAPPQKKQKLMEQESIGTVSNRSASLFSSLFSPVGSLDENRAATNAPLKFKYSFFDDVLPCKRSKDRDTFLCPVSF